MSWRKIADNFVAGSVLFDEEKMAQQTPLYEQHTLCGARMVDFHGWMMPLHYGSQIDVFIQRSLLSHLFLIE